MGVGTMKLLVGSVLTGLAISVLFWGLFAMMASTMLAGI